MKQPKKRTLKIRYNPNPSAERYAIKSICKALDEQRAADGSDQTVRRIRYDKSEE